MAVHLATVGLPWPIVAARWVPGPVPASAATVTDAVGVVPAGDLAAVEVGLAAAASYPYYDYGYSDYGYNGYGYNGYGNNGYYGGKSCLQPQTVWNGWGYQRVWVEAC